MSKAIVWTHDDGGVAITHLAEGADLSVALAHLPDGVSHTVIDAADLPADRTFRKAWKAGDGAVEVDMGRARDVWRDHIRRRRKGLLEALDVEAVRADEDGHAEAKARVVERKKRLRDAPADPRIEDAQTPEELLAVDPLA
jgi:hypothetical protein